MGQTYWCTGLKGIHLSPQSEFKKGHIRPKEWIESHRLKMMGENNPTKRPEVRIKMSEARRGSKSHLWKGGLTALVKVIRQSVNYTLWRDTCFKRDDYKCTKCGKRGRLEVDHIKAFSTILRENKIKTLEQALHCPELWEISNGRTLCIPCHRQTDTYAGNLK